jgi:hypothetical protein
LPVKPASPHGFLPTVKQTKSPIQGGFPDPGFGGRISDTAPPTEDSTAPSSPGSVVSSKHYYILFELKYSDIRLRQKQKYGKFLKIFR